jgi:diamine N-acetyltransferase
MLEIKPSTTTEAFQITETLADTIWREHYIPMVGKPLVDFLLENFQSARAIEKQVKEGLYYFLLYFDALPVGYVAIKPEEDLLFLSKFYVLDTHRKKGFAKKALDFILEQAKQYHLKGIRLRVNVNNIIAIEAYKKLGFTTVKPIKEVIENGFILDDYEMVKSL